jgi:hypothetical protein
MAGYIMKMNTLVPNINCRGLKDSSFKVRHKAYASRWAQAGTLYKHRLQSYRNIVYTF